LIVAEKALQSEARYELGFGEHLFFGFPSTLVLAVVGAALLVAVVPQQVGRRGREMCLTPLISPEGYSHTQYCRKKLQTFSSSQ